MEDLRSIKILGQIKTGIFYEMPVFYGFRNHSNYKVCLIDFEGADWRKSKLKMRFSPGEDSLLSIDFSKK